MSKNRGKVLVIENHDQLREALTSLLESLGYDVESADDAKHGLDKAREIKPDLVFCDLHIEGGVPCLDILKCLRQEIPQTKVIVTGTDVTCEEGARYGACYCLSHPIALADLLAALKHCLGDSFEDQPTTAIQAPK